MGASISTSADGFLASFHPEPFVPTATDARHALFLLAQLLPTELAISILEAAEYWPVETTVSTRHIVVRAGVTGNLTSSTILVSSPLPRGSTLHSLRRIRITIESRDQGFSSFPEHHNTREGSSSFFEVALVRPTDHVPQTYAVVHKDTPFFYNLHAVRHYTSHTESLTLGNPVVDEAQPNDRIVVYAAAQYPMWINDVKSCRLALESAAV
ncbi:hypothetical protein BCR35DRAFT_308725 [Leucosporidium creatinivorum]|uniref:Uncharacterized protein n=1 Tax=Leucosporidium creatinivorum TaxID=106004 RepID=A0A1Y2DZC5_9BASI|nr:hypothetical protein BCR35DRAFT_308725 [Leucosporidium creatinivorum]